ncbi:hypothetical protein HYH02_012600 [Chlamydomonas schloesseri]|uniref:Ribosomal protein L46 N-terminal domain-containing protein n=1 Tax=Chlamydomonas schloesseri TaxID=2026947 RepID=A0A835VY08_9CHLO|nr:hypothetical protein HYH02_012600 [Chlamydomonas schloesseri]|eukprot:KAG2433482.1 hypothetical protein HYH02_012600 [Chlamydomonas schloesseri]
MTDAASTSGESPVIAACVLQRLPLVRPRLSSEEQAQLAWERQRALQTGELKDYPQNVAPTGKDDAGSKQQQQQDLRTFDPVPSTTAADSSGDVSTMRRRLADSVYLVVRGGPAAGGGGGGEWSFPQAVNTGEESISDTAQRALSSAIGRSHPVYFIGNAPMGHVRAVPSGTAFFMLAQVVDDPWDTQLLPGAAKEFAWVTKQELLTGPYLADARLKELVSKML